MTTSAVLNMPGSANASGLATMIRALPPLPDVARQILDRFSDEFISASEVAAIVECDPAISARLFGLANSAYFGLPDPVSDMREVVSRVLGPDTVRSLAFALAADRTFDLSDCAVFDARRFWHRALNTAACCQRVARVVKVLTTAERDLAYLAGMCHNIGFLALVCAYPDRTEAVLQDDAAVRDEGFNAVCREHFGFSVRDVTYELAVHWDMPDQVVSAYRARSGGSEHTAMLATILEASISTSRYLERDGVDTDGSELPFPDLAADALQLDPETYQKASMGTARQRAKTDSTVQAMVGG